MDYVKGLDVVSHSGHIVMHKLTIQKLEFISKLYTIYWYYDYKSIYRFLTIKILIHDYLERITNALIFQLSMQTKGLRSDWTLLLNHFLTLPVLTMIFNK